MLWRVYTLVYFNARSLIPTLGELRVLCELHKSDIVFITETWLCEDVGVLECHCLRCDRHRRGRGVALFISNHLYSHIILCGPNQLGLLLVSDHNTHGLSSVWVCGIDHLTIITL